MGASIFQFKQFAIHQEACAMKVGTDGIVLGAWAPVSGARYILDIGAGTGLLALMAAQRNPDAHIVAVELDPQASQQAQENVTRSPWQDRIEVRQENILNHQAGQPYDLILCNPPYFSSGPTRRAAASAQARHMLSLHLSSLARIAADNLTESGILALILPLLAAQQFLELATPHGLHPRHLTKVRSRPNSSPIRQLMTIGLQEGRIQQDHLCLYPLKGNHPHPNFHKLAHTFYLHW